MVVSVEIKVLEMRSAYVPPSKERAPVPVRSNEKVAFIFAPTTTSGKNAKHLFMLLYFIFSILFFSVCGFNFYFLFVGKRNLVGCCSENKLVV